MGISAVVITYNEERNIDRCLSALAFVDEIIVVDSFSSDKTIKLAEKYTDKIFQREFCGFSDQKNAAVSYASNEWVLIVDADEVVPAELAFEIRQAVELGDFDAYRMPRATYFIDRIMRHCGWFPDYQLRLAKRENAHFEYRLVHETLNVEGCIGTLKTPLIHYSYESFDNFIDKQVVYAEAAARQKYIEGRRFRISDIIIPPAATFVKMYFMKQGFRDGIYGFMLSLLSAWATVLRYSMLWDISKRGNSLRSE